MSCQYITKTGRQCRGKPMPNGKCPLHGGSIISRIKAGVSALRHGAPNKASPSFQKFLDSHSQDRITKVQVARVPIHSKVHKALDAISFGRFSKKAKELNYDQVYHQYLLVTLSNGQTYKLEKNETVQDKPAKARDFQAEIFNVPVTKSLTLPQMISNASSGREQDFYRYRSGSNNCQDFTREMIVRNGLLPGDDPTLAKQDSKQLIATLPGQEKFTNAVTDLAAVADRLHQGYGIFPKKKFACPL